MNFAGKHILSIGELGREELLKIAEVAGKIDKDVGKYYGTLKGKIVATLFFEPSTRTRMSFQAAMQRMGGSVIGFSDISMSSIKKGESLPDTIKIISGYCDAIVMRHPHAGSVAAAAADATVPVINAGDGPNEHPTQTILDLYTMQKELGKLDGLTVVFVGDLKYGRTVHSLVTALSHFSPKFVFVSPPSLRMPKEQLAQIKEAGIAFTETEDLVAACREADVLYMTRVQKERFENGNDYDKVKGIYKLDATIAKHLRKEARILHPLPRVDEINTELDALPQSVYFKQAHNGIPVRMALLGLILGKIK
jgi:aspartate carbamoyltransferase catalytic subunit